jgi:DNA-directed RNA polymerase specialized sigma24 family protein
MEPGYAPARPLGAWARPAQVADDAGAGEGLELFRRAICASDQAAWEAVVARYRGLVICWTRRSRAAALLEDDAEYWVNRTFERFWVAVTPARFQHFSALAAVLGYLRLCAHSVLLDALRSERALPAVFRAQARTGEGEAEHPVTIAEPSGSVETLALKRCEQERFWRTITRGLPDPSERLLVHLAFARGLPPREIQRRHPERFPTTADVYRVKRKALDRLRRNASLKAALA